jgi:hypothetical protein
LRVSLDHIEGDWTAAERAQWLQAASSQVDLVYRAPVLIWPFTAELKAEFSSLLPLPVFHLAPRDLHQQAEADDVSVQGAQISVRLRPFRWGWLSLTSVRVAAELPAREPSQQPTPMAVAFDVAALSQGRRLQGDVSSGPIVLTREQFVLHGKWVAQGMTASLAW